MSWKKKADFIILSVTFLLLKSHFTYSFILFLFADCSSGNIKAEPGCSVLKRKKNFKIWFSPRSRKVRCLVETSSEVTSPESRSTSRAGPSEADNNSAQPGDMSIFNFNPSSQDSASSSSPSSRNKGRNRKKGSAKKNVPRRGMSAHRISSAAQKHTTDTMKKNKLEAINQQWGIARETDFPNKKRQPCAEGVRRSTKRVSFLSPVVTSDDAQPDVPAAGTNNHGPDAAAVEGELSENNPVLNEQTESHLNVSANVIQSDAPSVHSPSFGESPAKCDYASPLKRPSETGEADDKVSTLEITPKRPRASPARGRKSRLSSAVLASPSASPWCDEKKRYSSPLQCESPPVKRSPCSQRSPSGSPAVLKRNHKGETPLHIASIKVRGSPVLRLSVRNPPLLLC